MTVLIFLAVLVVLILVHELGHFLVAKKFGIRVDEFGIGFPPKIVGKKYGETEYTLNWLPIGGFVRIWGEDPTEEHYEGPGSERSFVGKSRLVQAAVLVAGVTMNVLLAYTLYVTAYMVGMPTAIDETADATRIAESRILVSSVVPNSPATESLKTSDEIVAVRSATEVLQTQALRPSEVASFISARPDTTLTLDIIRKGEALSVDVTPMKGIIPEEPERVAAGFSMTAVVMEQLPFSEAVVSGLSRTWFALVETLMGLKNLLVGSLNGTADYTQVAGPIGIAFLVGDAASLGFTWLLTFTAVISLNLAVINLLPIPALDGGRLLFVIIESITRRPIRPAIARGVNQIGFVLLLGLMALVTLGDLWRIFS